MTTQRPGPNSIYAGGLDKQGANYVPLTPLSFLERSATVRPDHPAVIYGARRFNWAETYQRCRSLASALTVIGIAPGDTVAVMLPNVPAMFEAHFGVPMAGAVLNALNTRLDAGAIAYMLRHSEAKVVLFDPEYAPVIAEALARLEGSVRLIRVEDPEAGVGESLLQTSGQASGEMEYEAFLATGDPAFDWPRPEDEWQPITLNYTSGTTGDPKGVVYSHRGAYLNGLGNIVSWTMGADVVYLWTLPMFHANGWCFPWTMAALGATNVCLRRIDPTLIFNLIESQGVTNFCAAPIVHAMLITAHSEAPQPLSHPVRALIAGAAPPAAIIEGMNRIGIAITHVYGLTETYGPSAICLEQTDWKTLSPAEKAQRNSRQGVTCHVQDKLVVMDPMTMELVPQDAKSPGEIFFRGNLTMMGYLKDPKATAAAFEQGWFRSGDVAVVHPDGYAQITDRSKDIIISGGENISSLEIEDILYKHPAIQFAAVVAMPDPKWGEVPCAFAELKNGTQVSESDIVEFCRQHLAGFKRPKKVVFGQIPKTSTGKIQKFILREQVRALAQAAS